jgi:hypothetical protein
VTSLEVYGLDRSRNDAGIVRFERYSEEFADAISFLSDCVPIKYVEIRPGLAALGWHGSV